MDKYIVGSVSVLCEAYKQPNTPTVPKLQQLLHTINCTKVYSRKNAVHYIDIINLAEDFLDKNTDTKYAQKCYK